MSKSTKAKIRGLSKLISHVKDIKKKKVEGFRRGVTKGALLILRESLQLVPVDDGILRASHYIRPKGTGLKFTVQIGYGASYALYVHEWVEESNGKGPPTHGAEFNKKHAEEIKAKTMKSRGPKQQAKFLEKPYRDNLDVVISFIIEEVSK